MSDAAARERELAKDRNARRRERERTEVRAYERYQWRERAIRTAKMYRLLPEAYPWEEGDYQAAIDGAFEILDRLARLAPAVAVVMETQEYDATRLPKEADNG